MFSFIYDSSDIIGTRYSLFLFCLVIYLLLIYKNVYFFALHLRLSRKAENDFLCVVNRKSRL